MTQLDPLLVVMVFCAAALFDRWRDRRATKPASFSSNESSLTDPAGIQPDQCTTDTRRTGDPSLNMSALSRRKGFARNAAPGTEKSDTAAASSSIAHTTTISSPIVGPRT